MSIGDKLALEVYQENMDRCFGFRGPTDIEN